MPTVRLFRDYPAEFDAPIAAHGQARSESMGCMGYCQHPYGMQICCKRYPHRLCVHVCLRRSHR